MVNPFLRASQRVIRRLGQPVEMVLENNERLEVLGVFEHPDQEVLSKGKRGRLTLKLDVPTLTVLDSECPTLNKNLRIFIGLQEYYPVPTKSKSDGDGCTTIVLADAVEQTEIDPNEDGGKWQ